MVACFRHPGIDSVRGWIQEGVGWGHGGWTSPQLLERLSAVAAVAAAADSETIIILSSTTETFGFEKTVHEAEIQTQDLRTNVHCTHVFYMYSTCG